MWKDWYQTYQRRQAESAIYNKLKNGPVFQEAIEQTIPREARIEETRPAGKSRLYPRIIGEHGTGKTGLITLAVNGMDEPKGVVYIDVDINDNSEVEIAEAMRMAMGWSPDQVIDSSCCSTQLDSQQSQQPQP
jgi:hypothetical protein